MTFASLNQEQYLEEGELDVGAHMLYIMSDPGKLTHVITPSCQATSHEKE